MSRFRSARSAEEEQTLLERATPPSTRYATKWALNIFDSWRASRKVKEVKIDDGDETDDICPIQTLTTSLAEMNEASLEFWLSKFVGEVANSIGNRYPALTLYCIVSGLNRHLSDIKGKETVNILDKNDRRYNDVLYENCKILIQCLMCN